MKKIMIAILIISMLLMSSFVVNANTLLVPTVLNDSPDQQQTEQTYSKIIEPDMLLAQSFIPDKNVLTKVELLCHGNLKCSIRLRLTGSSDLRTATVNCNQGEKWYTFDFSDLTVSHLTTYYIVLEYIDPSGSGSWGATWNDNYEDGCAWIKNEGSNWYKDPYIEDYCFITYGRDSNPQPDFYFLHITDLHFHDSMDDIELWASLCYKFSNMNPRPAFIICTGDLADSGCTMTGEKAYENILDFLSGSRITSNSGGLSIKVSGIPIYFCPGNHDQYQAYMNGNFDNYKEHISDLYYSRDFTVNGHEISIFSLTTGKDKNWGDTLPDGDGLSNNYDNEVNRFQSDVASSNADIKIALTHNPFASCVSYDKGIFWYYNRHGDGKTNDFGKWCTDNDVDLVFSGHLHTDGIMEKDGSFWPGWTGDVTITENDDTAYVITDSIGGHGDGDNDKLHYRKVSVYSDGTIKIHKQERFSNSRSRDIPTLNTLLLRLLQNHPILLQLLQRFLKL